MGGLCSCLKRDRHRREPAYGAGSSSTTSRRAEQPPPNTTTVSPEKNLHGVAVDARSNTILNSIEIARNQLDKPILVLRCKPSPAQVKTVQPEKNLHGSKPGTTGAGSSATAWQRNAETNRSQLRQPQPVQVRPPKPKLQGRCFGEYRCRGCGRYWSSAWSWSGYSQECMRCGTKVLPFNRRPLINSGGQTNEESPHMSHLCQKCQQLGTLCTKTYPGHTD